jgi:hypothetical protein
MARKVAAKNYKKLPLKPLVIAGLVGTVGFAAGWVVHASSPYRAFSDNSYWNTPFESSAPIDSNSSTYIADSENTANTQDYVKLTIGSYGEPIYFADGSDPLYTITASGHTVKVHIPNGATPASGSDGQMTVYDRANGYNREVGLHGVVITNGQYTADGMDSYSLSSNGLEGSASGADDSSNFGHRGVPSAVRAVRLDEIQAGAINHRLECFWWATAPSHYWPMVGHENNKGGVVPEGIVVRIKPSVNLTSKGLSSAAEIVATALQKYGCIVGDNSGSGNRLKLQENVDWTGILNANSLQNIPWSDWEFVKGGAMPQGDSTTESSGSSSGDSSSGSTSGSSSTSSSGGSSSGSTSSDSGSTKVTTSQADGSTSSFSPGTTPAAASTDPPSNGPLRSVVDQPVKTIFSSDKSPTEKMKAAAVLTGAGMLFVAITIFAVISFRRAVRRLPAFKI